MNITLKDTDSLNELIKITQYSRADLINRVINSLDEEGVLVGGSDDYGFNIDYIAKESGYSVADFYKIVFVESDFSKDMEFPIENITFFGALIFIGEGDCPDCGGDVEDRTDGDLNGRSWVDKKCNCCSWSDTGCPDFDTEPGGYDYDY